MACASVWGQQLRHILSHPLLSFERTNEPIKSAKQLFIARCDLSVAIALNREWHSVFPEIEASNCYRNKLCIAYACEFDGVYYASAIVTSPIAANRLKDGDSLLELRRLAICNEAPKYTATRFLSKIQRDIKKNHSEIKAIISYQNIETHDGTIYKASNWTIDKKSDFVEWGTSSRKRGKSQTQSKKIRWRFSFEKTLNLLQSN